MNFPAASTLSPDAPSSATRRRALAVRFTLGAIVLAAAALRFYGLGWGAPYAHFHIDEHLVFVGAYSLRESMEAAANAVKFFTYGPVPMHLLNAVQWVAEGVAGPLDLTQFDDQVTYMIMGRSISATMGTLTVLMVYYVGRRVYSRGAGLLAAMLLATTVMHISESHSFRVDLTMIFFTTLTWLVCFRIVERGRWSDYLLAGMLAGLAIGSKYSAAFIVGVIGVAHLLSTRRPGTFADLRGWARWTLRGLSPLPVTALTFLAVDPMALIFRHKFMQDVREMILDPVIAGSAKPFWVSQFADIGNPTVYWFTTNFWWSFGPALEIWGLLGIVWLLTRWNRVAGLAAAYPIIYFMTTGYTATPVARYTLVLAPAFALAAGAFSAWLHDRRRIRPLAIAATVVVVGTTAFYALAYMNVYGKPDARLEASRHLVRTVPPDSHILVEPAHSTPPTGSYLQNPQFSGDYVLWGTQDQHDYYWLHSLDVYQRLFRLGMTPEDKRAYIDARLALVDYIVMDDFFLQMYQHLPESDHGVVKDYYRRLFNGELGFSLMKTFKRYPAAFGITINDDGAELSSRMNDHPRIYIFKRTQPR